MARMQAVYNRGGDGSEPVDAYVERLADPRKQVALDNQSTSIAGTRFEDGPQSA